MSIHMQTYVGAYNHRLLGHQCKCVQLNPSSKALRNKSLPLKLM